MELDTDESGCLTVGGFRNVDGEEWIKLAGWIKFQMKKCWQK